MCRYYFSVSVVIAKLLTRVIYCSLLAISQNGIFYVVLQFAGEVAAIAIFLMPDIKCQNQFINVSYVPRFAVGNTNAHLEVPEKEQPITKIIVCVAIIRCLMQGMYDGKEREKT